MFTVSLLPAHQGDCLWIEYGSASTPHRILIDAGTAPTYGAALLPRLRALGPKPFIDLLIVTHIDADHIGGVLRLLDAPPTELRVGEVWFNSWRHIAADTHDLLGPIDGEILSSQLDKLGWNWNGSFRGARKAQPGPVAVPDKGDLRSVPLPDGMQLTILSPGSEQLLLLRQNWKKVCREAGLKPGTASAKLQQKARRKGLVSDLLGTRALVRSWAAKKTGLDKSPANGSTIAILAEYKDKSVLLPGDCFATTLATSIQRLLKERKQAKLRIDAMKVPHHGSRYNLTKELLNLIECPRFVFSTNGAIFNHPDLEAMARVVTYSRAKEPSLAFNYSAPSYIESDFMTASKGRWTDASFMRQIGYRLEFGDDDKGLTVPLG